MRGRLQRLDGLTPDEDGSTIAEHGYLHCGQHGAGHFVKIVLARFTSRRESEMADRLLSAMRYEFGGRREGGHGRGVRRA